MWIQKTRVLKRYLEMTSRQIVFIIRKETNVPDGGISESTIKENSSSLYSSPERQEAAKTDSQGPSPMNPHKKTIESKSLSMNSGSSPSFPKKKRSSTSYFMVFLALIAVIMVSIAAIFYSLGFGGDLGSSDKIAVIYVQGSMLTGNIPAGLGYATSEEICENIRSAVEDDNVRAIVLRVNSGGGSPSAAQEISLEIERAQEQGIPVVVSMGDLAASAAYYISARQIHICKSLHKYGIYWSYLDLENMSVLPEMKVWIIYVAKSGEFKDIGRELERAYRRRERIC
jgi:protease-4